jgi:hypothetical protein
MYLAQPYVATQEKVNAKSPMLLLAILTAFHGGVQKRHDAFCIQKEIRRAWRKGSIKSRS